MKPLRVAPTVIAAVEGRSQVEPEPYETQLHALAELRARADRVRVLSVTLVTDSVQVLVDVSDQGRGSYRALIAPSGRIHRLSQAGRR